MKVYVRFIEGATPKEYHAAPGTTAREFLKHLRDDLLDLKPGKHYRLLFEVEKVPDGTNYEITMYHFPLMEGDVFAVEMIVPRLSAKLRRELKATQAVSRSGT